ncbi:unnamed protein product, partial [Meganyctiphanes norvegica]
MGKQNSKLKPEVLEDLRSNTEFTDSEIQEWYKGFLKDCPTGHLSVEEFKKIYGNFFPYGDASKQCQNLFRTYECIPNIVYKFFWCLLGHITHRVWSQIIRIYFFKTVMRQNRFFTKNSIFKMVLEKFKMVCTTFKTPSNEQWFLKRTVTLFNLVDKRR